MTDPLESETLRTLSDLISKKPGLTLSQITECTGMKIPVVQVHLQYLEEKKLIVVMQDDGFTCYYPRKNKTWTRNQRTLETRKDLYELIALRPGLFLTHIAKLLNISIQLADYYLTSMERDKEIVSVKQPGEYHRRYYITNHSIGSDEKKLLELLGKKTPLAIILLLMKHQSLTHKEMYGFLVLSPSHLSYYLSMLLHNEIVEVHPHGDEKGYCLKRRDEMIRLMRKFRFKLELNVAIEEFRDVWQDLHYEE